MKARHIDTGAWETLHLDMVSWDYLGGPAYDHYSIDTGDEPIWADLDDFDSFEAA
jgi:hypothetical protein